MVGFLFGQMIGRLIGQLICMVLSVVLGIVRIFIRFILIPGAKLMKRFVVWIAPILWACVVWMYRELCKIIDRHFAYRNEEFVFENVK